MQGGVLRAYGSMVANGTLKGDPSQLDVAHKLQNLSDALQKTPRAPSAVSNLFGLKKPASDILGLYIWGDVGRGKTMLMDLFFERVQMHEKRRVHFHEFMDELHKSIGEFRQDTRRKKEAF